MSELLGHSPAMHEVRTLIARFAGIDRPVLVCGETGTGKELVARALHRGSGRRGEFVALNCAAIPTTLFESEVVGFERGAFTDAKQSRAGAFERANGGTLFLDELGELSLANQAKLLRLVEHTTITRLGGVRAIAVNVRMVAATNRDLAAAIEARDFRQDLYYRLAACRIMVPPLRQRGEEDLLLLIAHFVDRICRETRCPARIGEGAMRRLLSHSWPGNVRELEHVLVEAFLRADGRAVEESDLSVDTRGTHAGTVVPPLDYGPLEVSVAEVIGLPAAVERMVTHFERTCLSRALARHRTASAAARALKINRRTLYEKTRKYGIHSCQDDGDDSVQSS